MKKVIVLLLMMFIFPIVVYAERSNSVSIKSTSNMKVGDISSLDFTVDFKDINRASSEDQPSNGFLVYIFELEFDDSTIDIYDIVANDSWDVTMYKDANSGKYYVEGHLNGNMDSKFCPNKVSYCDSATVSLSFGIKETDKTSTTVKVTKLAGIFINTDGKNQISESDLKTTVFSIDTNFTISISKYEEQPRPKDNTPKFVIEEKSNVNLQQEIKKETETSVKKKTTTTNTNTNSNPNKKDDDSTDISNKAFNNYLKSLEIEGYSIDFNKHQSIYSIEVPQEVNELKVNAIAEATNAKVEVVGANNLEENNNKIVITVTAENKDEKKYIINVKRIKEERKNNNDFFEITDDQKKLAIIFAGIIVGIGILAFIIIRIRDRKVEKNMDKW